MYSLSVFLAAPSPIQIVLIVAVILLLFGGKKIPELMKGLGTGIKEFKDATKDTENPNSKKDVEKNDSSKTE